MLLLQVRQRTLIALGIALIAVGCGPARPKDMPVTFPCSITVVDGGRPIAGATVVLVREEGLRGITVNGTTNANGVVRPRTVRLGARYAETGVPSGRYLVSVEKLPTWDEAKTSAEVDAMSERESEEYSAKYARAMETLLREVPRSLSRERKQSLEVVAGSGGHIVIDVADFQDQ